MTPKSGKPGSLVAPAEVTEAKEADEADPGEVAKMKAEQAETKSGKYGSEKTKPYKPTEEETSWIEIELIDEEDQPVPGMPFEVTLSDGSVYTGTLDNKGFYRVDKIPPGECKVSFPTLDQEALEKA